MIHYCPECIDAKEDIDIEDYRCDLCRDVFCTHFMKSTDYTYNNSELHDDDIFGNGHICWICGSDYKPKI